MDHPLDNPVWAALRAEQGLFAMGKGRAIRFRPEYGIFAAVADHGPASLEALRALIQDTGPAFLFERDPLPAIPGTVTQKQELGVQMVAERLTPGYVSSPYVSLGEEDAAEMLALATLAEPGPFFPRTHELGNFVGVKRDGRLVAMAGERLRIGDFVEVSAVCTHPEYRGRGYAGDLLQVVAQRISARRLVPILHSYADNLGAIALYETLGFRRRCEIYATTLAPVWNDSD